ncbi:5686_t:CDS:2, partial [Acaulospora colombiana]
FLIPCNTDVTVAFKFGDVAYTIDARDLVFGFSEELGPNDTPLCYSSIMAVGKNGPKFWVTARILDKLLDSFRCQETRIYSANESNNPSENSS